MQTPHDLIARAAAGWLIPFSAQILAESANATEALSPTEIAIYEAEAAVFEQTALQDFLHTLNRQSSITNHNEPQIPQTWLAPVAAFWQSLSDRLADPGLSDIAAAQTAREAIAHLPELINAMDIEALAELFDAAMGQAAVISMRARLRRRALSTFSVTGPTIEGVAFAPMTEAVNRLQRKTAITAALNTEQWRRVPVELRERAFFSARVESARFLSVAKRKLEKRLSLATETLENGKQALVNRDSFIRDMRRIAEEEGIQTTGPAGIGTVRDIRSVKRLGLIYDIQTDAAAGYARWKMDTDADVLDEFPAYRLGPSSAAQPRPESYWRERWAQAGAAVNWQGAARVGMVAIKTSPIWSALSIFDAPWPPFDFGSSRMLEDVDRDDAAAIGLLPRKGPVPRFGQSGSTPEAFNGRLEASTRNLAPELQSWLQEQFGDQAVMAGDRIIWRGSAE